MIEVALASNRNYFVGLEVTVLSLLRSNKNNVFRVNIIDGGLSRRQQRLLARHILQHNRSNALAFHSIGAATFRGFRADYGNSYMAYARILLASLVQADRVIYLDSDLLVAADIKALWDLTLDGYVAAAAQDSGIKWLRNDYPFDSPCGDERYFNSGVMVMNLLAWRRLRLQEKLLEVIATAPQRFQWWDQTAMNAVFRGQVLYIDDHWNRIADSAPLESPPVPTIFHYVGAAKPWNKCLESGDFSLWRSFYARYVRSRIWLCLDAGFLSSLLRHLRHRAIVNIPLLRQLVLLALAAKGLVFRRSAHQRDDFARRHLASGSPAAANLVPNSAILDSYLARQWSE